MYWSEVNSGILGPFAPSDKLEKERRRHYRAYKAVSELVASQPLGALLIVLITPFFGFLNASIYELSAGMRKKPSFKGLQFPQITLLGH